MRKIKFTMLAFAVWAASVFVLSAVAVAQGAPGEDHMGPDHHMPTVQEQMNEFTRKLKLTDDQKPKVREILEEMHDRIKQLRDSSSGSVGDTKAKMREIHDKSHARIREVLTDEQKPKFDRMLEEQHHHMGEGHGHGDAGSPPPPDHQ